MLSVLVSGVAGHVLTCAVFRVANGRGFAHGLLKIENKIVMKNDK